MNEKENIDFEKIEENPDHQIRQELGAEGWQFVSNVTTHMTPFNPDTGRFDPKEIKTSKEIEEEYLSKYETHGFSEVKLVRPHKLKGKFGFIEDEHSYDVYLRKPEDAK